MQVRERHIYRLLTIIGMGVTAISGYSGWAMMAQAEEAVETPITAVCAMPETAPAGPAAMRKHHLDATKLEEAAKAHSELAGVSIVEVNDDVVAVIVKDVRVLIQGSGEVIIFHVPPEATEELISAIHKISDEVNNAC